MHYFSKENTISMYNQLDLDSPRTSRVCRKLRITDQLTSLKKQQDMELADGQDECLKQVRYEFYLKNVYKLLVKIEQLKKKHNTINNTVIISESRRSSTQPIINPYQINQNSKLEENKQKYLDKIKNIKIQENNREDEVYKRYWINQLCQSRENELKNKRLQFKIINSEILREKEKQNRIEKNKKIVRRDEDRTKKIKQLQERFLQEWQGKSNRYRENFYAQKTDHQKLNTSAQSINKLKSNKFYRLNTSKSASMKQVVEIKLIKIQQKLERANRSVDKAMKNKVDSIINSKRKYQEINKNIRTKLQTEQEIKKQQIAQKLIQKWCKLQKLKLSKSCRNFHKLTNNNPNLPLKQNSNIINISKFNEGNKISKQKQCKLLMARQRQVLMHQQHEKNRLRNFQEIKLKENKFIRSLKLKVLKIDNDKLEQQAYKQYLIKQKFEANYRRTLIQKQAKMQFQGTIKQDQLKSVIEFSKSNSKEILAK